MPLPSRYHHTVRDGTIDLRFCSGICLRNWRRNRTCAASALQAALSAETSHNQRPEKAHPQEKAAEWIAATAAIPLPAFGLTRSSLGGSDEVPDTGLPRRQLPVLPECPVRLVPQGYALHPEPHRGGQGLLRTV
jgi:hypothetical protein